MKRFTGGLKQGEFDLLIALGGDGTMLRVGHLGGPSGVPILGINLGRFGFLTEIAQDQWAEFLPRMIAGEYWLEKRMMLCAEQWRADSMLGKWDVLNEVVVSRGQIIRPVHVDSQCGWQVPDHLCGRRTDRRHTHRFNRLCPGSWRPYPAARAAQYPAGAGCPAPFVGSGNRAGGRVIGKHHRQGGPPGSVQRRWAGADRADQ